MTVRASSRSATGRQVERAPSNLSVRDEAHRSLVCAERVFQGRDHRHFLFLSFLSLSSMALFVSSWVVLDQWGTRPLIMSALSLALAFLFINQQARWFLLPSMKRPVPMPARRGWKVGVATTYVLGAESFNLLERTLRALVALDYPHETWVLDEGDRLEVRNLCARLGARHYSRASKPAYRTARGPFQFPSKHGNYNAWLHEVGYARYDIVSAFDPDHMPDPSFLDKVLGYFDDDQVGYVQTPQAYSNQDQSLVARGAAEETYGFYSTFQMACYGRGHALVIGCHNTHRVRALNAVGGYAAHDADDLLLTLHYRQAGWAGVYVPEILARGLTPADWESYLRQQRRWARAILDLKCRVVPGLFSSLPWRAWIVSLVQGLHYVLAGIIVMSVVCFGAVLVGSGAGRALVTPGLVVSGGLFVLSMVLCRAFAQRFYLDPVRERGWHWRAVLLQVVKCPWVVLAVLDVLVDRRVPYVTTPKPADADSVEARAA
ncbi:MAG: glycosyltransferase [Nitrospira sp.]|nr:MAG: glycosyltransferase [Nitrospira sp.]